MTAAVVVKGWCPSLHEPMAALDGLIVRVKPFVRGLSAADLQGIAAAAEAAGAGGLELTGRGALQVRGLDETGAATFARAMVEAGLASADPAVERRRNIQLGVGCGSKLLSFAAALETWLEEDASLSALPAKFGFAVSPDAPPSADIVVVGEDADSVLVAGEVTVLAGSAVLDTAQRLTRAFLALAPLQATEPRRMKGLIQAVGVAAVLAEAGLTQAERQPQRKSAPKTSDPWGASPPPRRTGGEELASTRASIARPPVGPGDGGYGLGVVFGVLAPSALRAAADLAARYADGRVLLAPSRVIWLSGVSPSDVTRLVGEASAAGFIVDPHDSRLRLDACVGRSGCARASEDVRADALRLARLAPATGLHVSGCAKGCAHPRAAGATLVSRGAAGRYDLILDGAPFAPPTLADGSLDEIADRLAEPAL
jgi:precorrin-3B synthase